MLRWACCGLVLAASSVAFGQTKDVIIEFQPVAPLVPNPFGGLPVAARQPLPPKLPTLPVEQPVPRRTRPVFKLSGPPKLDRNGDPLPAGAVARFGSIRLRHGVEVQAMTFTHDGKFLCTLSASEDSVKVWDTTTAKEVTRLNASVRLIGLAKDGSIVLVENNRIRVWLPATNTVRELPNKTLPEDSAPTALAVNPDGRSMAVATNDKVLVIDLQTGKTLRELKLPGTPAAGAAVPAPAPGGNAPATIPPAKLLYSPDGRWLAGNGQNTGVWLWDLHTGKRIRTYRTETDSPEYAFSPDVTKIAITGGRLRLFSLDSEEEVDGFVSPQDAEIFAPRFSGDGKTIFVVQQDARVTPIDAATGEAKEDLAAPDMELHAPFALASGGAMAAAIDKSGGIRIWNPNTGEGPKVTRFPPLTRPGITPGGKSASVLDETHKLHTFDLATGTPGKAIQLQGDEDELAVPDAAFHRAAVIVPSGDDLVVHFIDTNTGKEISKYPLPPNTDEPRISFASANRDRVAIFTQTSVIVVNPTTGKTVRTFTLNNSHGAISPDGRLVVTSAPALTVWEVATGKKRLGVETLPSTEIMVFSADSRFLAFWDQNGNIVIVDVRTGAVARRIQDGEGDDGVTSLALSSDGKRLGVGSALGYVTVYDLTTGEILAPFGGHDGPVTGLVFTADGKRLVSTSQDGTAIVWGVPEQALPLNPAANPVISSDEAYQLLGSTDPTQAQRGLDYFYHHPAEAVKQASTRMPAPTATPAPKLAQLVADLASDDFTTREAAVKGLEKVGGEAGALLKEVMQKSESAEARKLAGELLGKIEAPAARADDLRILRIVEVMENLRTPEARMQLEKWAAGPAGHRLTVEATGALERLKSTEGK